MSRGRWYNCSAHDCRAPLSPTGWAPLTLALTDALIFRLVTLVSFRLVTPICACEGRESRTRRGRDNWHVRVAVDACACAWTLT
eukprot:6197152-Pleurochrysis_carterae.AAC.1